MSGDAVFVNNASMGLYAKIVQSPAYRERKVATALEMLPDLLGTPSPPFDLRFTGPDGEERPSAHLILVSNGRYELTGVEGFGSRRRIDAGILGIVTATFRSPADIALFIELQALGLARRFPGWMEWTDTSFEVRSARTVEIGIDGEATAREPAIRFRTVPKALRVRIPHHAPGYSAAAAVPTRGWSTFTALWQTAVGRPVSVDPRD
jgi:diacylglycerol kinase family enzyme